MYYICKLIYNIFDVLNYELAYNAGSIQAVLVGVSLLSVAFCRVFALLRGN